MSFEGHGISSISWRSGFLICWLVGMVLSFMFLAACPAPLMAQEPGAERPAPTIREEKGLPGEEGVRREGEEGPPAARTDLLYRQGTEALENGDLSEAERIFSSLLNIAIDDPRGYIGLGEVYYAQKRYASAERYFLEALKIDGKNVEALLNLGRIKVALLREDEAFEYFQEVVEIDEKNGVAARFLESLSKGGTAAGGDLPREYYAILVTPSITREELAALIYFRTDKLDRVITGGEPKIITDISDSWAKDYILEVTTRGIMDVYPNYTFLPRAAVERGELAQILNRLVMAMGYRLVPRGDEVRFSDVLPTNRYFDAIRFVGQLGLVPPFPDNTFRPSEVVSGEEAIDALDHLKSFMSGVPRPG